MKNINIFVWGFSLFLVVKFSIYLNRRVFVMGETFFFIFLFFSRKEQGRTCNCMKIQVHCCILLRDGALLFFLFCIFTDKK